MQPPDLRYEWVAADGTPVTIRPIRPEDRDIERAFVRNLSPSSKYLRFLGALRELSPRMLDKFTQVDYPREMALIATIPAGRGEREIGVARYAPGSAPGTVEFAVVVADEWQGRGVGRELLRHLFDVAAHAGFERLEGVVLKANRRMLQLAGELGFSVGSYHDDARLAHIAKDFRAEQGAQR